MFIDLISKKTTQVLIEVDIIELEQYDIYLYGLQLLLATIFKGFGLFLIALLLGYVKESIVFII